MARTTYGKQEDAQQAAVSMQRDGWTTKIKNLPTHIELLYFHPTEGRAVLGTDRFYMNLSRAHPANRAIPDDCKWEQSASFQNRMCLYRGTELVGSVATRGKKRHVNLDTREEFEDLADAMTSVEKRVKQ